MPIKPIFLLPFFLKDPVYGQKKKVIIAPAGSPSAGAAVKSSCIPITDSTNAAALTGGLTFFFAFIRVFVEVQHRYHVLFS